MKGVIAPLYIRSIDDMDVAELCDLLDISLDDIKERFNDRLIELGLDKSYIEHDTDDDDGREIGIDFNDALDSDEMLYYDDYEVNPDADDDTY